MDIITLLVSFLAAHLPTLLSALSQNTKWRSHFVFLQQIPIKRATSLVI